MKPNDKQNNDDKNILITIQPYKQVSKQSTQSSHTLYVPKQYTVGHLKSFFNQRVLPSKYKQQTSYFLFAYGSILNNHERIGHIYEKHRQQIKDKQRGLQIKYAEMSSF